ncbi:hypothetical protein NDU88_005017 [Pleurodeles waltl]|uniref:Secreted protein n=1 Tax=Pleurodeles waltl TaxID=8319 RepID=A0AAV7W6N2_PLEWA|nr:hypothetical protein NDU88_005017 [Pleurodeles waltl]
MLCKGVFISVVFVLGYSNFTWLCTRLIHCLYHRHHSQNASTNAATQAPRGYTLISLKKMHLKSLRERE